MQSTSKTSTERWEAEGGAGAPVPVQLPFPEPTLAESRVAPHIDHKPPPDDDCGMPPHPIFSDYAKDLWTSHTRSGGVPSLVRSRNRVGGRSDCEKLVKKVGERKQP